MERIPQPKARLIVNVMEHGTVVGTDDPVALEFEDCVNAVSGLVGWLAAALGEVNEDSDETIGTAILVEALHEWTFNEHVDESEDDEDAEDEDEPVDPFPED
ncbi:MAG: hypothetical protein A2Y77_08590 [Planctomycetes bacterium RBG_13_62_9]|nr:MAG: hypothetical protein A2Y77_08590 [Planctomycetes bacterium RBG_13_62_9]